MLEHKRVINNYICENDEDEAHLQADENDPLLFGIEEQSNVFMNDEVDTNNDSDESESEMERSIDGKQLTYLPVL